MAAGLPQNVEQSDLVSYGIFGLIDAIEKFDLDRGYKFETYAIARIKGAILDELRSIDWVPRSVRAKARALEKAYTKLEASCTAAPPTTSSPRSSGHTDEQLQATLSQISFVGLVALDEMLSAAASAATQRPSATRSPTAVTGPVASVRGRGDAAHPRRRDQPMPDREKIVLTLYYYEGLTLAEIGHVLGVTESRVCQIHTKAVLQLRARLSAVDRELG